MPDRLVKEPLRRTVGKDTVVYKGEVIPALKKTPYKFVFQKVSSPKGLLEVVEGQATGRYGVKVNFVVLVSKPGFQYETSSLNLGVKEKGLNPDEAIASENVEVLTNAATSGHGSKKAEDERSAMASKIARKVFSLMSDVTLTGPY